MKSLSATFATVNNKRQVENEKELWKICSDNLFADFGGCFARTGTEGYSITTLNGLPIASPNPDNKLVPLNLFPSSTVQNITVSKVYNAETYADYSGAHIDIVTKVNIPEDFLEISLNTGGSVNTIFRIFICAAEFFKLFFGDI